MSLYIDREEACDWLTGYLLRKPGTRAAILLGTSRDVGIYLKLLHIPEVSYYTGSRRRMYYPGESYVDFHSMITPDTLRGTRYHIALVSGTGDVGGRTKRHTINEEAVFNLKNAVRLGDMPRVRYVKY